MTQEQASGGRLIFDGVTVVTGHKEERERWSLLVELAIYWAALYYVTHPDIGDKIRNKLFHPGAKWLQHKWSVWQAREAINSLPETDNE